MNNKSTKQIRMGAIISYIAILINIVIGMIYTPWMVSSIGSSNYGLYTLAISVIAIFTVDFGLSSATTRFVAKGVAEGDTEGVQNILGIIIKLYLILSMIIFIILFSLYPFLDIIYTGLTESELEAFHIVYIIVATYSLVSFPFVSLSGILAAYEEFIAMKLCELFQKLLSVIMVIVILSLGYGLYALVTVNAATGLVFIVIKLIVISKKTSVRINWIFSDRLILKEIFTFSIWTTVVSICQRLIFNLVPSILGIVSSSISIAQYGIASAIDGYVYTFASAISGLFLTRVTRLIYDDKKKTSALTEFAVKIGRIQLVIVTLIYVGFMSIGYEFINLWIGENYSITYYCVLLLSFPSIIEYPQQIADNAIIASNKIKAKAKAYGITAAVSIPLTFVTSFFWGSLGAAISIWVACICRMITMCFVYKNELEFDLRRFLKNTYSSMVPVIGIYILFALILNYFFMANSWLELFIKGVAVTIVYIILITMFFLDKKEKVMINNFLKNFVPRKMSRGNQY